MVGSDLEWLAQTMGIRSPLQDLLRQCLSMNERHVPGLEQRQKGNTASLELTPSRGTLSFPLPMTGVTDGTTPEEDQPVTAGHSRKGLPGHNPRLPLTTQEILANCLGSLGLGFCLCNVENLTDSQPHRISKRIDELILQMLSEA